MSVVRTATYFNRLSRVSSEMFHLRRMVDEEALLGNLRIQHAAELSRIYGVLEAAASKGYIRTFFSHEDPLWKNDFVLAELRQQGFMVNPSCHSSQGSVEWWYISKEEKENDELQ